MKYSQHYSLGLPENRKGYGADRIVMNISLRTSVPHSEHFTECLHYAQAVTKQDAAPAAWELIKSRRSHMQITLKQSPSVVSLHLCFSMYLKERRGKKSLFILLKKLKKTPRQSDVFLPVWLQRKDFSQCLYLLGNWEFQKSHRVQISFLSKSGMQHSLLNDKESCEE
ncbi:uncharacterized protein [Physeter macrocephalus]|uniref:Uncharacterized protein isoform X3 n=1 Tax=Physeter macrocephalus TaxID=9755 RepID=A0A9W2WSP4_PHYMC|nr:uncharacterized protein LOC114486617 isoform X3 [Physeter catodon]